MASASTPNQQRVEEKAVLSVCLKFLSGIKDRDAARMHECILADGHGILSRPDPDVGSERRILNLTLKEVVDRIPIDGLETLEENIAGASWEGEGEGKIDGGEEGDEIWYEGRKTEIRIDHDLAMAWTPFVVRIGGEVKHFGTNIWTLVKMSSGERKGEWIISGVADTARWPMTSVADGK